MLLCSKQYLPPPIRIYQYPTSYAAGYFSNKNAATPQSGIAAFLFPHDIISPCLSSRGNIFHRINFYRRSASRENSAKFQNNENIAVESTSSLFVNGEPDWLKELKKTQPTLEEIAADKKSIQDFESLPPISKISRNLISNIVANQPANGSLDQGSINELASSTLGQIPLKQAVTQTKIGDLNLIGMNKATIDKDAENYGKIYLPATEEVNKSLGLDLKMINDFFSGSKTDKKEMAVITARYSNTAIALKKAPLPAQKGSVLEALEYKIINNLEKMAFADNDIINSAKDSINAYSDLYIYYNAEQALIDEMATMDYFLKIQR